MQVTQEREYIQYVHRQVDCLKGATPQDTSKASTPSRQYFPIQYMYLTIKLDR